MTYTRLTGGELDVPVAIFVFNRPVPTRQTFEAVASARPRRLFLVADGPRTDRVGEAEACAEVRSIVTRVDWPCEVATNFSETNLGCGRRMSSGIDWLFSNVEEAILIEDDCVASPQFFDFCRAMLSHFRHDARIGLIGGTNVMMRHARFPGSYIFSRYPHVWGWATWRRSWASYDFKMTRLDEARKSRVIENAFGHEELASYWYDIFRRTKSGEIDTWDYQLFFASFCNNWLNVIPSANLIRNVGFGPEGTHCTMESEFADLPIGALPDLLEHPEFICRSVCHDDFDERYFLGFIPHVPVEEQEKRLPLFRRMLRAFASEPER